MVDDWDFRGEITPLLYSTISPICKTAHRIIFCPSFVKSELHRSSLFDEQSFLALTTKKSRVRLSVCLVSSPPRNLLTNREQVRQKEKWVPVFDRASSDRFLAVFLRKTFSLFLGAAYYIQLDCLSVRHWGIVVTRSNFKSEAIFGFQTQTTRGNHIDFFVT